MKRKNKEDIFSESRKVEFTTWVLNLIVTPIIVVNIFEKHYAVSVFAMVFLIILNTGLFFYKRKHDLKAWANFILVLLAVGVLVVFYTGGEDKAGVFWTFLFPVLTYELKGYKKANPFIIVFLVFILILYAVSFSSFSSNHYSFVFFLFYFMVLVSVTAFSYAYDRRRHDTEEKILLSKEKLETLYDHLPLGVVMIDDDMKVLESNALMKTWFPELKKDKEYYCYHVLNPDKTGRVCNECPVKSTFSDGKVYIREKRKITSEGEKYNRIISKPVRDSSGKVYAVLETLEDITNQKIYEKQLKESEEQIKSLTDNSQAGIYMYRDNRFIMVNPATSIITGYSREELLNMSNLDVVHPEERQKITEIAQKRVGGEKLPDSYELKIQTRSGETKWVQHSVSLINLDGKPTSIGTIFDITDRKNAEADLGFNYRFQQLVADISQDFITATPENIDNKINTMLQKCGEILQVDRSFFFQFSDDLTLMSNTHEWCAKGIMPVKDLVQNYPVKNVPWIAKVIKHKEIFYVPDVDALSGEYEKEKEEFKKQMIKSVFVIPIVKNDRLLGYFGYDAVKQKRTVDENHISLLQIIANILGDAILNIESDKEIKDVNDRFYKLAFQNRTITWEVDGNGLYTFISPVVKDVLGYEPEEITGKMHFYDLFPEDLKKEYVDRIKSLIDEKEEFVNFLNPLVSKKGDVIWMETNSIPVFNEKGEMTGLTGSDTDITARKIIEDQLEESRRMYADLLDNLPGFVYRCANDKDWTMHFLSRGCRSVTGYDPGSFIQNKLLSYKDIIHPDWKEKVTELWKHSIDHHEVFKLEYPVIDADKKEKWVLEQGKAIRDQNDELLYLEGFISDITQRKRAEESLRKSEEKYRLITENAKDVIWILNINQSRYTYISPSIYQLRGLTTEEALNERLEDSLTPDSLKIVKRITKESVEHFRNNSPENQQSRITQIQQPCKDGKIIWVEVSTQLQLNRSGEMEVLGVSRNIDDRKKMEKHLQYQSDMRKLISDISSLFISYNDENFGQNILKAISDAAKFFEADRCQFYRFNKSEDIYKLASEYVPQEKDVLKNPVRSISTSDFKWWFHALESLDYIEIFDIDQLPEIAMHEKNILSGQGIQSLVSLPIVINQVLSGFIIFDTIENRKKWTAEQLSGMRIVANILSDAMEKYRTEKELRLSEIENKKTAARFQEFIFASNTGAWEYNIDTGFLWCSQLYFTMLGRNMNDFSFDGQPNAHFIWKTLIHHEDYQKAVMNFENYQKNPSGIYEQVFRMMHKNGNPRWILSRGRLLQDEKGNNTPFVVGTHIDITEQKHFEQTIISKNKELESYLYVTSHDLRSPLVNIQGFSKRTEKQLGKMMNIIEQQQIPEDQKNELVKIASEQIPNSLSFIFTNVQKMDNLIKGLLAISRTGRVKMKIYSTDMNSLINRVIRSFAYQTDEIGATIMVDDLPDCFGDENLLNQLFSNLIDNAIKYRNPQKKLQIHITGKSVDGMVQYAVKDNGIGVNEKNKIKIWDVFFRADPHSNEQGDGIGLNLVLKIVEKHQGSISMDSEEGHGSTFWVKLQKNPFEHD